jgi:hypothetical protein
MSFDLILIALITGGLALSVAYVRAEYHSWREQRAAQRRKDAALRDLHAASLFEQRGERLPNVLKLQGFGESEAANPDDAGEFTPARRASGSNNSTGPYPLAERRKRARKRAFR